MMYYMEVSKVSHPHDWIPTQISSEEEFMKQLANASRRTHQVMWTDGAPVNLLEADLERIENRLKPYAQQSWYHSRSNEERVGPFIVKPQVAYDVDRDVAALDLGFLLAELQPNVLLELIRLARLQLKETK